MNEKYNHLFFTGYKVTDKYKTPPRKMEPKKLPIRNQEEHSRKLLKEIDDIWLAQQKSNDYRKAQHLKTKEGTYLTFISELDYDLATKSLENIRGGIRILNVQKERIQDSIQTRATIYIPNGKEKYFVNKIADYQKQLTDKGKPKNNQLVASIAGIQEALVPAFWTDRKELMPGDNKIWCEVWIRTNIDKHLSEEDVINFQSTLKELNIIYKKDVLNFPERSILLIEANIKDLSNLISASNLIAEFRIGQETAGFWLNENISGQTEWIEDILNRLDIEETNIKVCILDSGVNEGHPLLKPLMNSSDALTVEPLWGTNDHYDGTGHGTPMCGICGYGDLEKYLASKSRFTLTHKICSVKIIPPSNQPATKKELWGLKTIDGVSEAEIANSKNKIIYCMAITSVEDVNNGKPSSWSAAIDDLCYGEGDTQRLIIISSGNITNYASVSEQDLIDYPIINSKYQIQNPAQSWNALVVGAYTDKIIVNDSKYDDYTPLANKGELSPFSTTSTSWEKKWPIKPDIVFEGGNLLKSPTGKIEGHEDLSKLTISKKFHFKPFTTLNATSLATAQATYFAGKIAYKYPHYWPETIRGLMIHSASWTKQMFEQLSVSAHNKGDYARLLSYFGYGLPSLDKALYSIENAFTLITEEEIQPFAFNSKGDTETKDVHFFNLPWPKEILLEMSSKLVTLKVTLSYYVEAGPGEIGWENKYRYQSHGLRFDINAIGEDEDTFKKKINVLARDESEESSFTTQSNRWKVGANNRTRGSVQTDIWEGTAADLAECNLVAVYPVIGWWRERKHLGRVETKTRYSLIISLETPEEKVELYTAVKNKIEIDTKIQIEVQVKN